MVCDIMTAEIEHVDCKALEELEQRGFDVQPHSSTFRIIQVSPNRMPVATRRWTLTGLPKPCLYHESYMLDLHPLSG